MRTFHAEIRDFEGAGFIGEITSITGTSTDFGPDLMDNLESLKTWVTDTPEDAGRQLKNFLNGLGLPGVLRVTFVNEITLDATPDEFPTGEPELPKGHRDVKGVEWTYMDSHSWNKQYEVTWDPRYRNDGNYGFSCECNHFFYRLDVHNREGQMQGGVCKHIEEAVDRGLADSQEIEIPGVTFRF